MKRSRNLKLVLMAAAVPVVLAACNSEPTGTVVQSVEQCTATANLSAQQCEQAYQQALTGHATAAPRFESQADCNTEFQACTPVQEQGRTMYMPPMSGFLIGYLLGNSLGGRGQFGAGPLYRNQRGEFLNSQADRVARAPGPVTGRRGAVPPPTRAITVSRQGFGSSSAARSAFGRGS
ncbi:MAG: DUF1190 domain-containing protein [Lysobacter sp.]|nr:DUF1190 domain-containing protein [Lysobacter sp.]